MSHVLILRFLSTTRTLDNMLLIFISAIMSHVHSEEEQSALRFGNTFGDYIQLKDGMMDSSTSQFSVCTWVKTRFEADNQAPIVLHYWSNGYGDICLASNGYYNTVVNTNLNLEDKYNVPDEKWFHLCWTWTTSTYILTVYLNGDVIGTAATNKRQLKTGVKMCLGNRAQEPKYSNFIFGGDMFRLNIYSRVLSSSEIQRMSSDMCSVEEELLTPSKILSWEEILLSEKTGSVTKIPSVCAAATKQELSNLKDQVAEIVINNQQELDETKNSLNSLNNSLTTTQEELTNFKELAAATKQELSNLKDQVAEIVINNHEQELDETKNSLNSLNNSLTTTQEELTNFKELAAATKQELSNLKDQVAEIVINNQQELDETKNSLNSLNNSLTTTQEELTKWKELAAATKQELLNFKDQVAEIVIINQQELDETKTSLNSFNNSLTTTQEELTNWKELAAATKQELSNFKDQVAEIVIINQQELDETKTSLNSLNNSFTTTQEELPT